MAHPFSSPAKSPFRISIDAPAGNHHTRPLAMPRARTRVCIAEEAVNPFRIRRAFVELAKNTLTSIRLTWGGETAGDLKRSANPSERALVPSPSMWRTRFEVGPLFPGPLLRVRLSPGDMVREARLNRSQTNEWDIR